MADFAARRARMVERQLRRRGIGDERVLAAMAAVPRERFLPAPLRRRAYEDSALPIGEGQTISQPWIVAAMTQALALRGDELALEVGTGSGYSAAVLARLVRRAIGIERNPVLAARAKSVLGELGVDNVEVIEADGSVGAPTLAPFAAIAVHATAPAPPLTLLGQLGDGGRLVVPIAGEAVDALTLFRREGEELRRETIGLCRFVPLIGAEGYDLP